MMTSDEIKAVREQAEMFLELANKRGIKADIAFWKEYKAKAEKLIMNETEAADESSSD